MARKTRSVDLAALKISPEVGWYMESRGIPFPTFGVPLVKTPEPRTVAGATFDPGRVDRVLAALRVLRHTQGEWAGRPLIPDPWQVAWILGPVFGWVKQNSRGIWVRIIREAFIDEPRKNGKTTTAGGIGMYLTGADGEPGAQVLAVAASKQQAGYCFAPVKALVEGTPALQGRFRPFADKITHPKSGSYFQVVASVGDLLHGSNPHGAIVDELHAHKNGDVLEAVESGTGARAQPLVVVITTTDSNEQNTVYAQRRRDIEQLANRTLKDPARYGVIFAATPDMDPFAEETWKAANPGYGVSPTREFMIAAADKARSSNTAMASFLRFNLGIRTRKDVRWINLDQWDENAGLIVEERLAGRVCWAGLDLASTSDFTAWVLLFPTADGLLEVLPRFFIPEAAVTRRAAMRETFAEWSRNGFITVTDGDVVDDDAIKTQIQADADRYSIRSAGCDPWDARSLMQWMQDEVGLTVEKVPQNIGRLSGPSKELERRIGLRELRHGGHPVLRWMADNAIAETDGQGRIRPNKQKSSDKIDGIVALVLAIHQMLQPVEEKHRRVFSY